MDRARVCIDKNNDNANFQDTRTYYHLYSPPIIILINRRERLIIQYIYYIYAFY